TPGDRGLWPLRVPPIRAGLPAPPQPPIAQVHRPGRGRETQASRLALFGRNGGELRPLERLLGRREVTGIADELRELGVRHRMASEAEWFELNRGLRASFGRVRARP